MSTLNDCDACMKSCPRHTRQLLGCGYETPVEGVIAWTGEGYDGPAPSTCIGYTRKLPEVIEVARARRHWDKGELRSFTEGEQPSRALVMAIEIMDSAANEVTAHYMAKKDGA